MARSQKKSISPSGGKPVKITRRFLDALTGAKEDAYYRVLDALGISRREDISSTKAARRSGTTLKTTIGLLRRLPLQSKRLIRIGKEVDRLGGDEGATLEPDQPVEYEGDELAEDIDYLAQFPQVATAQDLGLTERGWRKIIKCAVKPLATTAARIQELAEQRRIEEP